MKTEFFVSLHLFLILVLTACSGGASIPTQEPTTSQSPTDQLPAQNEVEELLIQLVDTEQRAPGMVIGMISADPPQRWVVGYGKLSQSDSRVPDGDTVFEIASVSKVFTGTLLGIAVQAGEAELKDPIQKYLPTGVASPKFNGMPITLLDLATQSSGLPGMPSNFKPKNQHNPYADYTLEQMYSFLSSYELPRQPGMRYEYSNYAMSLLGNLLATHANQADYEALLVERICEPLQMNDTRIRFTPQMQSRLAAPHNSVLYPDYNWDMPTFAGGGGIRSTANDMLKFLAANMGISQTELLPGMQLANTSQRPTDRSDTTIGLAWQITRNPAGTIHWHNGQTAGYHSYLGWDPDRKIGVVVLSNAAVNIDDVGMHLLDPAYEIVPHKPRILPTPIIVEAQKLLSYAGTYKLNDAISWVIRIAGNRIFLQQSNMPGEEFELFARSDNQFFQREADVEITFSINSQGIVDKMIYAEDGYLFESQKIK